MFRKVAEAALESPDKTVRSGIFPVMSEEKCKAILKEYQANRRMVPLLVNLLDVRSNNTAHRPVVDALTLVKRYAGTSGVSFPASETVPLVEEEATLC